MTVADAALFGGVFHTTAVNNSHAELRALADEIGSRAFTERLGKRQRPEQFDSALWQHLEDTGLARLTSTPDPDAGPAELAVVLYSLARRAGAVPLAETDLLAAWLGQQASLALPADGPMTVGIATECSMTNAITGTALGVPWSRTATAVVMVARSAHRAYVGTIGQSEAEIIDDHNLAGEPRDSITFEVPLNRLQALDSAIYDELVIRGAWARCIQVVGALDAAAESSVAHCRERVQFGRPLSRLQAVQHSLAMMAGEIEKGRAATELAIAAACDHGFSSAQTRYAVTAAKVVLGRISEAVVTTAHQLHGAIGVTLEHPLWLATTRSQSWIREFGSTNHYAAELGRLALNAREPWEVLTGEAIRCV